MFSVEARWQLEESLGLSENTKEEPVEMEEAVQLDWENLQFSDSERSSQRDSDDLDEDDLAIPTRTCKPCRAPVNLALSKPGEPIDKTLQVIGYINPGSAAIFLQEEVAKRLPQVDVQPLPTEKFKRAVEGKAKYTVRVQLAGRKRGAWVVAYVLPIKDWPFAETEILVGIPGMADTELSMTMQDGDFILHYNKLNLVQRVNQQGELVKDAREAPPVATITREQTRQ